MRGDSIKGFEGEGPENEKKERKIRKALTREVPITDEKTMEGKKMSFNRNRDMVRKGGDDSWERVRRITH